MTPSENAAVMDQAEQDKRWMQHAMALAERAEGAMGEIPLGAVRMLEAPGRYSDREVKA